MGLFEEIQKKNRVKYIYDQYNSIDFEPGGKMRRKSENCSFVNFKNSRADRKLCPFSQLFTACIGVEENKKKSNLNVYIK